jgi:hypothetical protein
MKFTISTLLALAIAAPVAIVKAKEISIPVESTLDAGLIKVFPGGDFVKLRKGTEPQYIDDLYFTSLFQAQRFDVVDDRMNGQATQGHYLKVSLELIEEGSPADMN